MIIFLSCCTSIFRLLECKCLFSISGQIVYHKTDNKILTLKQQIITSMMIQRERDSTTRRTRFLLNKNSLLFSQSDNVLKWIKFFSWFLDSDEFHSQSTGSWFKKDTALISRDIISNIKLIFDQLFGNQIIILSRCVGQWDERISLHLIGQESLVHLCPKRYQ